MLRTRGARGCNFWLRIKGEIPQTGEITCGGAHVGEWRADGHQTKIRGTHPNGMEYSMLHAAPPVQVDFSKIVWPQGWSASSIRSEIDALCEKWGEPGFFEENKKGSRRFTGLDFPLHGLCVQ